MLRTLRCVNYRGFADLTVEGLGRVNLVIGRNNSGKTSLIAAGLALATGGYPGLKMPLDRGKNVWDRERGWRPIFRDGDEARGLLLAGRTDAGEVSLTVQPVDERPWWYRVEQVGREPGKNRFRDTESGIEEEEVCFSQGLWVRGGSDLSDWDIRRLTALAYDGRLEEVAAPLRRFDPRIDGIELIGDAVVVRLVGQRRRLPVAILGDGAYRLLEIALARTAADDLALAFDEPDNGVHHAALGQLWELLRDSPPALQIFATTHRDECVLAAARAFLDAGDDGLRVIRLDREGDVHRAVLYTAAEAAEAIEAGWEIRG